MYVHVPCPVRSGKFLKTFFEIEQKGRVNIQREGNIISIRSFNLKNLHDIIT